MIKVVLVMAVLMQSGCAAAVYAESRRVTRLGITPPLASLEPGIQTDAAATCVMKGLTQGELLSLPNSGTLDDPATAKTFVAGVIARPSVAACLSTAAKI